MRLFEIVSLSEVVAGSRFTVDDLCDYSVGANDGRVCLLFMDWDESRDLYAYRVVVLDVDWETGRCLGREVYDLGSGFRTEYCWISALGDDFLLVWCRCWYNDGDPERNGLLVGRDGTVRRDYCFGDGIGQCLVLKDGTIVTGYDLEGVYGNYGWGGEAPGSSPVGRMGLVAWRPADGRKVWSVGDCQENPCSECDAISQDAQGRLWFYKDGEIIRRDFLRARNEVIVSSLSDIVEVRESDRFAVASDGRRLLFGGGTRDFYRRFFMLGFDGATWRLEAEGVPELNGVPVGLAQCERGNNLSDYRTLWLTDSYILCGFRFV